MIESVRTPEPRVQGQGISPVCDFASRPATKEQTAFRRQPATSFPLVPTSFPLVPDTRQRVSHSLITRADRTNGREMLCSPELHQTTRTRGFSNAPLPCLPCFSVSNAQHTVHLHEPVTRAVRTHGCDIMRCDKCNNSVDDLYKYVQVQCSVDGQAQTLLLTKVANLPPPANTKHSGKSRKCLVQHFQKQLARLKPAAP